MQFLFILFGLAALFTTSIVVFSRISLIFKLTLLILTFIFIAFEYLMLDLYFLGLTYIIVYVGAISILFLFVIMMTNNGKTPDFSFSPTPTSLFPAIISFTILIPYFLLFATQETLPVFQIFGDDLQLSDIFSLSDIQIFGRVLFLTFPPIIILIAILLWCILIGILRISGL